MTQLDKHYDINTAGSVNPSATSVNDTYHIYEASQPSRMAIDFENLRREILKEVTQETIEELKYYITKLPGTKPFEEKLNDGGFSEDSIEEATRLKELYRKRAQMYRNYPSAQQINLDLLSSIKNSFYTYIYPLIEDGTPLRTVMQQIRERIVLPTKELLNKNGMYDDKLRYNEDHIYGMIYYLTGMCHLNWTVYKKNLEP